MTPPVNPSNERSDACDPAYSRPRDKDMDRILAFRWEPVLAGTDRPPEFDETTLHRLSPITIKACGKLAQHWNLTHTEIASLLGMASAEYEIVLGSPENALLEPEQFNRAGLLIEIFDALQIFSGGMADRWPRLPNKGPLFGGRSPVQLMQEGGVESMRKVLGLLEPLVMGAFS